MSLFRLTIMALSVVILFVGCAATNAFNRFNHKGAASRTGAAIPDSTKKKLMTVTSGDELDSESDFLLEDEDEEFDGVETLKSFSNKSEVYNNLLKITGSGISSTVSERILSEAVGLLNTPYKYGGTTEKGIDCSAFTQKVYQQSIELQIPRSTREQFQIGEKISKDEELDFGDLVFFKTRRRSAPSHVGIYIGDNKFMHASRKKGVMVSSLDEKYWTPRYIGARRLEIK